MNSNRNRALMIATLAMFSGCGQAMAQTPAATSASCVSSEEVKTTDTRTETFLQNNTSGLRQADMDKVRSMLGDVMEPMRRAAASHCKGTTRAEVKNEVRTAFEQLYNQVGVGGRMLFDNYKVPMYDQEWMGGNASR